MNPVIRYIVHGPPMSMLRVPDKLSDFIEMACTVVVSASTQFGLLHSTASCTSLT